MVIELIEKEIQENYSKMAECEMLLSSPFLSKADKLIVNAVLCKILEHNKSMLLLYKYSDPFDKEGIAKQVI
jgi:hypothetical protein